MSVILMLVSAMMGLGDCLVDLFLGGDSMSSFTASLLDVISCVAAWLGGGASFPSWTYKADTIRAVPGRRHHCTCPAPTSP